MLYKMNSFLKHDMKVSSATIALKAGMHKTAETIVIHHSKRGIQYCSKEYVRLLNKANP